MHFSRSEALHMQLHQQPNVPVSSEHTKFVEFMKPLFEWREKKNQDYTHARKNNETQIKKTKLFCIYIS